MIRKYDNAFTQFINETFLSAPNAAEALGCSTDTIYNNCRKPTGGYKVIASLYEKIVHLREQNETIKASYADLATRYNELVDRMNGKDDAVAEYLGR